jgi:hypothetical protein
VDNIQYTVYNLKGEEAALDWVSWWGVEQPMLGVQLAEEERTEGEEITDHQLAQLDTIAALLRMDILPRLRYILTVGSSSIRILKGFMSCKK